MEALSGSLTETLAERLEIDLECIPWGQSKLIYNDYMVIKFYNTYDMFVKGYKRFVHMKRIETVKKILEIEYDKSLAKEKRLWKSKVKP